MFSKHELRQIFRSNISFYRTRKFSQLRNWIKNHDVPTFRVESDKKGILFLKRKNRGSIVSRITWRHSHCCPSRLKVSLIDDTRDRLAAVLQDNDRLLSLLCDGGASRRWKGVGKAAATFGPSSSRARPTAAWIKYGRDAERCIRVGIATSFNHHVAHICSHLANNHASGGRCLQQTGAFKRCFDQACANVDRDERLMIRSLVLEEQRLLRIGRICSMLDA